MMERKREREPGKSERPSKKVAVGTPEAMPTVQISMIHDVGEWCPVIGMFLYRIYSRSHRELWDYTYDD
jgi:hypothetical protein